MGEILNYYAFFKLQLQIGQNKQLTYKVIQNNVSFPRFFWEPSQSLSARGLFRVNLKPNLRPRRTPTTNILGPTESEGEASEESDKWDKSEDSEGE
jgi:hypothetical protein